MLADQEAQKFLSGHSSLVNWFSRAKLVFSVNQPTGCIPKKTKIFEFTKNRGFLGNETAFRMLFNKQCLCNDGQVPQ